ncbi:LysR substrate-binding domain-containing protein [Tsukamurella soli]|uniref:LysR substrate-binding domain-containing protein n=1 Tax=Tsukamurella soli TaxID=644556 RepID=A0ABP8J6U4_9ACTN
MVTLLAEAPVALAEVSAGTVDAAFRSLRHAALPDGLVAERLIDDRHQVLVGPQHPLAAATTVTAAELAAHPLWMPGLSDSEPVGYYEDLAATFGLSIDTAGPSFGVEDMVAEIAASPRLATLVGAGSHYLWPESLGLRRIPVVDPCPVYPLSLVWRRANAHPVLADFLGHLRARYRAGSADEVWVPAWAG